MSPPSSTCTCARSSRTGASSTDRSHATSRTRVKDQARCTHRNASSPRPKPNANICRTACLEETSRRR
ncbi:hypothetical protein EXIGLDRAFT_336088 [Exidia glandulosa HHB12029]|uniref:Uncharacterized protein n=1 Tax=Exidia glandulosa HHB12029 TaxID=1314781 RepID=A0A165CLG8_EXIGL|nr:hypothetical protein EXIGLDRAFT_336088 [Exidia glandulosa HHB12029]